MKKIFKKLTILMIGLSSFLFVACGKKSSSNLQNSFHSFVQNQENVIAYGYIDLDQLIEKTDILNLPMFGAMVAEQLKSIKSAIHLKDKIYMVAESEDITEQEPFLLTIMSVNNIDSLKSILSLGGYYFEEENGIQISEDMNTALGYNQEFIAIAFGQRNIGKEKVLNFFNHVENNKEKVNIEFEENEDLMVVSDFNTFNHSMQAQNAFREHMDEDYLNKLSEGAKVKFGMSFLNGEMTMNYDYFLNEEMKEDLDIYRKSNFDIQKDLGAGFAYAFMNLGIDTEKAENYMNKLMPESTDYAFEQMGAIGLLLKSAGHNKFSEIFKGDIAFAITNMPAMENPENIGIHGILSLQELNFSMIEMLEAADLAGEVEKLEENRYKVGDVIVKLDDEQVLHIFSPMANEIDMNGSGESLKVDDRLVGKLNADDMVMIFDAKNAFEKMNIGDAKLNKFVSIFDFVEITGNSSNAKVIIKLTNAKHNFLKVMLDTAMEVYGDNLNNGMMF